MARNVSPMSFLFGISLIVFGFKLSEAQKVPALYVFGDSLVDVGNNNYLPASISKANFPHNGIDFPTKIPTGRYSNGKNVADFVAEKLGLPTSPAYLSMSMSVSSKNASAFRTGVNFASGGAGIFNGSDQILGQSIPLTTQISYYELVYNQKMASSAAQQIMYKSLFAIVVGSNDLFDYSGDIELKNTYTPQHYIDLMAVTLKGLVKRLYNNGARKFVFPGIGPLGCTPSQRNKIPTEECNKELNSMAVKYNGLLNSRLQELQKELKGFSYSYFDTYNVFQTIVAKAADHGFSEVKAACCGLGKLRADIPCLPVAEVCSNRRDHVFWDPYHPTEAIAKMLMDALFSGPSQYTFPVNVMKLVTI